VEQRGRLRVTLRNEEDVLLNPELRTRARPPSLRSL
jgi:hypothetical protein